MINKVTLIGRVGKDPEIRDTANSRVANFSLATSEKYKDKESTEWHSIVIWGKLVDVVDSYIKKGDLLYVEGKIATRSWEKDGQTRYATEIVVYSLQMLGAGKTSNKTMPTDVLPFD